jgi:hypothetical protein
MVEIRKMNEGTKIAHSFELIENLWAQVTDMGGTLAELSESAIKRGTFQNLQSAGGWGIQYEHSAAQWNYTASAISFPLMEKKRRKAVPSAWLHYQISLAGSGIPALQGDGQESHGPVIHISFWHVEMDFAEPDGYVSFPLNSESLELQDNRLFCWESSTPGLSMQWTYSLRLFDLNNEDVLVKSILEPVQALLAGKSAAEALPASLPGLIFYVNEDDGEGAQRLMAQHEQ